MLALLIALTLIGEPLQASAGRLAPLQAMRCRWFSNFESSRFEQ